MVSGEAYLILETGQVLSVTATASPVPGSMHAWRNATSAPIVHVTTVFGLEADAPA